MKRKQLYYNVTMAVLLSLLHQTMWGQDTLKVRTLTPVSVATDRPSTVTAATPTHVVTAQRIEQQGGLVLSDAIKQLPGITLKDYGGVGGMKTVSARGLGSQFSTLTIDGVAVNDCQNGQIDLGRYMLGNADYVSFANGQMQQQLQSARAYAAGNVIEMHTRHPQFVGCNHHMAVGLEGGSFGLLSPSLLWEQRLSQRLSLSIWANHLRSRGDYPFTLYYTNNHTDSSSVERRQNSQMYSTTVDVNLFYDISSRQQLMLKLHGTDGFRALPGPVTLYSIKHSEFSYNRMAFVQGHYQWMANEKWRMQLLGKYSHNYDGYEDTASLVTAGGYLRNNYWQQEGYLSGSVAYHPWQHWTLSVASDHSVAQLKSNLKNNSQVERYVSQQVVSASYITPMLAVHTNLLATWVDEMSNSRETRVHYRRLSPYVGLSLRLMARGNDTTFHTVRLRYFFKENYRIPNFNEMYYFTLPRDLRPERALQQNIGLIVAGSFHVGESSAFSNYSLSVDGYYNHVNDKIIAVPTQNLFLWSMMNLGRVQILGLEATAESELQLVESSISLSANYSYQYAVDVSDASSRTYRQQIPYTPRHSGGVSLYWENRWIDIGYQVVAVGRRYRIGENVESNRVNGYLDQSITVAKRVRLETTELQLRFQVLNIFDVQYEVVKNYPMMGRNYRLGLVWRF